MEKKIETTMVYWGDIGILEKTMETTTIYWGIQGFFGVLGFLKLCVLVHSPLETGIAVLGVRSHTLVFLTPKLDLQNSGRPDSLGRSSKT